MRTTLLNTPVPAYISGHTRSAPLPLRRWRNRLARTRFDSQPGCDELPGVTRKFDSLWVHGTRHESYIYGGIHWKFNLKVGKTLGEFVTKNTLLPRVDAAAGVAKNNNPSSVPICRNLPKIIDQRKD